MELKEKLQAKLDEHFNKFVKVKINNINMEVMPKKQDVPLIEKADYNRTTDTLEIFFANTNSVISEHRVTDNLIIYIGSDKKIVGLTMFNFASQLIAQMEQQMFEVIKKQPGYIYTINDMPTSYKEVEDRKFNFFNEILHQPQLVTG